MRKWLKTRWETWRLTNLKRRNVVYSDGEIAIQKGFIKIRLKAVFDKEKQVMKISGNHVVVENRVVEAIWKVLWNEPITGNTDSPVYFCDVEVLAAPNFLYIHKDEVIPMD